MRSTIFHSPTILIITDRTDLDDQLSKQFISSKKYIGDETVVSIDSREKLRQELQGRTSGGVYMTTIQKFTEDLKLLTDRANVICISDEAHRSQINLNQKVKVTTEGVERTYGFAKYLHDSLPNATYVGFTGTPVDGTIEVFGPVVDAYTMTEAVKDGITVNLVYDGRAARVTLDQAKVREIEDYYDRCAVEGANEHQIEESQKAVAHIDAIIGDPDRLHAVAEDFINHYETRVSEGATVAGKAMFVCSNRKIAYAFYQIIVGMRPEWAEKKVCPDGVELTEKEKKELKPIEKLKLIMTRNKDDEPELYEMLGTKDDRKEFDRQFKNVKSNFKIAIVVDMWLTGFDVPALDTIYIDKPIQQHTLIQTISRVNRVYTGKDKGLIVDYIGIKKNMNVALKKYTNFESDEFEGVEQSVTIVKDQLDVLAQMFHNFNSTDYFNGSPKEQLACLNRAVEYVQLTEDLETRFMAAVKRMKQAFNLCSSSDAISDKEKDYLHFYCAVRSILFKLTKGDAPDISQMNARVRELLEGAIQSDGIEELFETGKHISVDIFSDEYLNKINAIKLPNTKIKVLQRLLSQAIDEYKKVNRIMGMEFSDRLRRVVDEYNNRRRDEAFANERNQHHHAQKAGCDLGDLVFLGLFRARCRRFFRSFLGFFLGFQPILFRLRCRFLFSGISICIFFLHQSQKISFVHKVHKVDCLRPFAVPINDQIERIARLADQRDKLLSAAIGIVGVVIVHQRQVALRGQSTRSFIRDGDNILHHLRQDRLLHRGGFALKGKSGSCHASAQHRRYQQRTQFLNLHQHRPPSQKLHPRQTAQPGSGWRLPTAAAGRQAVPA